VVVNRPGAAVFPGSTGVGSVLMFSRRCLDYRTTRTACLLAFCACDAAGLPAAIGRSCTQAWPPSSIILGTIVFRALGNQPSPSHAGAPSNVGGPASLRL
jgi:hypothetical protein